MALKFMLDSLEGLDDAIKTLYTEQNGKFYLDVDGAVSNDKVSEFRTKNIDLMKDLDALKAQFDGVDPAKYKEMADRISELDGKKTVPMEEMDRLVSERVQTMKAEMQETIDNLTKTNGTLNSQLESLIIDTAVRSAATKHKVLSSAVDDVVLRAKSTFKMEKGAAMPYDSKGNVIYDKDGETPLTVDGWVKGLEKSAGHLFEGSQGSGARPNGTFNGMKTSDMSALQKIQAGLAEAS